jgi:hypothetical protein
LHDPAVGDLKMPAVCLPVADRRHYPRGLPRFEDHDDLIRFCAPGIGLDKFVAATLRSLHDRGVPRFGLLLHPDLKLFCGTTQNIAADRVEVSVGIEKPDHSLGLLRRLDQPVE